MKRFKNGETAYWVLLYQEVNFWPRYLRESYEEVNLSNTTAWLGNKYKSTVYQWVSSLLYLLLVLYSSSLMRAERPLSPRSVCLLCLALRYLFAPAPVAELSVSKEPTFLIPVEMEEFDFLTLLPTSTWGTPESVGSDGWYFCLGCCETFWSLLG